jgi:hypothetical protein
MPGETSFALHFWDYFAFLAFFVLLSAIGFWVARKERTGATEDFLAGKRLPWYVVGSFIASNIRHRVLRRHDRRGHRVRHLRGHVRMGQRPLLYASPLVLP